ncbi:hypothetical protein POM88_053176 [Heracleum sosnowskyi]|uniref:Uncharacterized protein n=1 Tax=Heracleum sosnowskyi TaxID=360622 RepID=A0AAD8GPQ1_9APIA|nr:hypothetical protein POM88_053176 [Heracleum sosnowskyi]
MSVHSMPSPDKGKKKKSSIERQTEVEKYAVVNSEDNIVKHGMPSYNGKKRKSSTKGETVVNPEDNIINLEEESYEDTTLESEHLGLEARIWRLENIFDMIKAAKFSLEM